MLVGCVINTPTDCPILRWGAVCVFVPWTLFVLSPLATLLAFHCHLGVRGKTTNEHFKEKREQLQQSTVSLGVNSEVAEHVNLNPKLSAMRLERKENGCEVVCGWSGRGFPRRHILSCPLFVSSTDFPEQRNSESYFIRRLFVSAPDTKLLPMWECEARSVFTA